MLHNETVNVWSHLLGVLAFIGLFIWSASSLWATATYKELLTRDPYYVDATIQNRAEIALLSHSDAGNITEFDKIVMDYFQWNLYTN